MRLVVTMVTVRALLRNNTQSKSPARRIPADLANRAGIVFAHGGSPMGERLTGSSAERKGASSEAGEEGSQGGVGMYPETWTEPLAVRGAQLWRAYARCRP
jgi:hypothetical protein